MHLTEESVEIWVKITWFQTIQWHSTKVQRTPVNNEPGENKGNCDLLEGVVSDLAYDCLKGKWPCVCLIWDLNNRKIMGHSTGSKKMLFSLPGSFNNKV